MKESILSFEDLENLKLAEDLAKTCVQMYSVTSTGLAPEIVYFNVEVRKICVNLLFDLAMIQEKVDMVIRVCFSKQA